MATGVPKRTRSERVAALELAPGTWRRLWSHLRRREVMARLGLCLLTAAAICTVIGGWDPPFSYRVGDVPSHSVVARVSFEVPGPAATDAPEQQVSTEYQSGDLLAEAGQTLGGDEIRVLRAEYDHWVAERSWSQMLARAFAVTAIILGLLTLCGIYVYHREPELMTDVRRLALMLALVVVTIGVARWVAADAWQAEIIPLLLFGQTVAIAYRRPPALLFSGVAALVVVLGLGLGLGAFLLFIGVLATAILQLGRIRTRSKLIYVGGFAALAAFLFTFVVAAVDAQTLSLGLLQATVLKALWNALWAFSTGFLMLGLLFFIERLFGVLTDMSLLELGDVSHKLLQELVNRAPGTYNHSIIVGSIAEAAADAIGAWGLLARVGAYFHDIGKTLKPVYFIENQPPGDNLHEGLVPAMSTLVIVAHVKDGADLARQHKLPKAIIDLIEQHHGTTLVEYFYDRASEQSRADPNGNGVEESTFQYPGPKPQSKEAGVLMIADAAESASRSLVDPGPKRIEAVVEEVTEKKLQGGQFDESGLTLPELRTVQQCVAKALIANYHGRVKYPDQRTA